MAEYTSNLNLFKPGTDDNLEIESTLRDNFEAIDSKLGSALTDLNGTKWTTLKQRIDNYQSSLNSTISDVNTLKQRTPNVKIHDHFFRTIALRGMKNSGPENTLPSYRMAADTGVYGLWFDVQLSSDNVWVCIQDPTVDRTTNGTGTVRNMTLAQLRALDAGSKFHSSYANARIPTIDETLELCRTHQVVPYVNLIGTYVDLNMQSLVNKLSDYGLINDAVIVSDSYANLQKVRNYSSAVAIGYYNTAHSLQVINDTKTLGNAFVIYPSNVINATAASDAKNNGVMIEALMVSSTNAHSDVRALAKYGVRGYITDKVYGMRGL